MVRVETLETPSLGDRSHLVTDGEVAVVVDPQRDVDRVLDLADDLGVDITHVLETHLHNDYVSGGLELARRTGAAYVVAAAEDVAFAREPISDGGTVETGGLVLRAVHTPGHTPHHLSYVLLADGREHAVFTGGSLLYGAVGRPDLIAAELTERLARDQHRSARRLAGMLPPDTVVHPTHGFGSHCSSALDAVLRAGTIGDELERNPALTLDENEFLDHLLAGLHPYPRYYAHMGPINARGPEPLDSSPPRTFGPDEIRDALASGAWVVDLRRRHAFAADHVHRTVNIELRNDLPTYLGWVLPWGTPFVLLGDSADDVAEAQRMLARIGLDRPAGAGTGEVGRWAAPSERRSWPVGSFADLRDALDGVRAVTVLDVREAWEWKASHHPQAVHLPFHEVPDAVDEVPPGEVWVYCATGNRATLACSLLERAGRSVVLLDDFCLPGDTPW